ncbi:acyltransferase family protein [Maribacter algarum]|uniref:acyltransferase family protein n=1 Tax=Maribacter algarum (ex Zhang et al. 2020) TaxID=2578118 RepID=UPI001EE511C8|nr:acyltransferase family protein [Maribacter algarum]
MTKKFQKTERIHSLDSLRAIMMLLGLVLHSALTYNVTFHGESWSLKDPETTHIFSDSLVFLIHSFRMPIFFVVAGFFGAMLFYERQPMRMVKNRVSRIIFPFVVFLFILWPITIFAFGYTDAVFSNQGNPFEIATQALSHFSDFIPRTTSHLWFLYYLALITSITVILGLLLKNIPKLTQTATRVFNWVIQRPITRILFFSGIIFLILNILGTSMVDASVSLIPDLNTFVYFLFFYLIGWVLYKSKQHLKTFMRYDWICTILAIVLATIQGLTIQNSGLAPNGNSIMLILYSSVVVCLFMFGITGLFIRYGSKYSARMRYISDSSYWVYLIHLPITAILPGFISKLHLPAAVKFMIVLSTTAIICFVSYHYFVRSTFIGKFLNGRKYPRKNNQESVNLDQVKTDK